MNFYKYLSSMYGNEESRRIYQERSIAWRKEPTIKRIENPTRLDRARSLGYKAKQGIIVVRVKLRKSKRLRPTLRKGRRSKHRRRKKVIAKNFRLIAEERCSRKYSNMEVLNSYYLYEDGKHKWFEIILVDKNHNSIRKNKNLRWLANPSNTSRVHRGLTAAGKKSRGLLNKGKGSEKIRPSLAAKDRKAH